MSFIPWQVKLLAYSENPLGQRMRTYRCVMPRSILAECNTHCALARNSASSRAVPTKIFIERIRTQPYIPDWTKKSAGMSGKPMTSTERYWKDINWLKGRDAAIASVLTCITDKDFRREDISDMTTENIASLIDNAENAPHKQDINRILEPWLFMDWIVSGTDWENVFFQRVHKGAHPAFQRIAYQMAKLGFTETPKTLLWGEWHLPYVEKDDINTLCDMDPDYDIDQISREAARLSAARCGRISFLKDGWRDIADDLGWFERHIQKNLDDDEPPHVSPTEHPAMACEGRHAKYQGWKALRQFIPNENHATYTLEDLNRYEYEMGLEITLP